MLSSNPQGRLHTQSIPHLSRLQAWKSVLTTSSPKMLGAGALAIALLLAAAGWHSYRVQSLVAWLDQHDVSYEWYHLIPQSESTTWHKIQSTMAPVVGPSVVSDIYTAKITKPSLTDEDLVHLASMVNLRKLTLSCDGVTDETLARVAGLKQLRTLSLVGGKFTFEGLLELRRLPHLRQLSLTGMQLSMAELAVLESAVPVANLKYNQEDMHHPYEREVVGRYPRNKPTSTAVEVGFEPLIKVTDAVFNAPKRISAS